MKNYDLNTSPETLATSLKLGYTKSLPRSSEKSARNKIIAVPVSNQSELLTAAKDPGIDLITLSCVFPIKQAPVNTAVANGILFELNYGTAIANIDDRKAFIQMAAGLVRATRGKNLILSSGGTNPMYLRSPADVVNMACCLLGLSRDAARDSIGKNCEKVLNHVEFRNNTFRGTMSGVKRKREEGQESPRINKK